MLAAQKHLQLGFRHYRFDAPESLPRIFFQIAHTDVEGGAAPHFHCVETTAVERSAERQQVVRGDPSRELALLAVARREVRNFNPAAADRLAKKLIHVCSELVENIFSAHTEISCSRVNRLFSIGNV